MYILTILSFKSWSNFRMFEYCSKLWSCFSCGYY